MFVSSKRWVTFLTSTITSWAFSSTATKVSRVFRLKSFPFVSFLKLINRSLPSCVCTNKKKRWDYYWNHCNYLQSYICILLYGSQWTYRGTFITDRSKPHSLFFPLKTIVKKHLLRVTSYVKKSYCFFETKEYTGCWIVIRQNYFNFVIFENISLKILRWITCRDYLPREVCSLHRYCFQFFFNVQKIWFT